MSSESEVVLSEWNPLYPELASEQMKILETLFASQGFLDEHEGKSSYHMGSTSIKGLLGKPMIDFTVLTKGLMPYFPDSMV